MELRNDERTEDTSVLAIAERMEQLYVNYSDRYVMSRHGCTFVPKRKDGTCMRLSRSNLIQHLLRRHAISVFSSRTCSRFMCLDVDEGGVDMAARTIDAIVQLGVLRDNIHVSSSGNKGYHVEIFFDSPIQIESLTQFYHHVLRILGATFMQVELKPTHKGAIKLPLSVHTKTGNMCWFVDRETFEPIKSASYIMDIEPMAACAFHELLDRIPLEEQDQCDATNDDKSVKVDIPVNEIFAPLTEIGTRHERMLQIAVYLRHHGADPAACSDTLFAWYRQQPDELIDSTEQEVAREIRKFVGWVHSKNFRVSGSDSILKTYTLQEMQRVMSHQRRSDRHVHFLLLLFSKRGWTLTHEQMMPVLGLSRVTISNAIQRLADTDGIEIVEGRKRRTNNGFFVAKSNRYKTNGKRKASVDTAWVSDKLFTLVDSKAALERFHETFYAAVHDMFGGCDLKKLLLPREFKEYQKYVLDAQEHIPSSSPVAKGLTLENSF